MALGRRKYKIALCDLAFRCKFEFYCTYKPSTPLADVPHMMRDKLKSLSRRRERDFLYLTATMQTLKQALVPGKAGLKPAYQLS